MPNQVLLGLALTIAGTTAIILLLGAALIAQMMGAILAPLPFVGGWIQRHLYGYAHQWLTAVGHIWDSHLFYVADIFRIIWAYFSSMWDGIYQAINGVRISVERVNNIRIPNEITRVRRWVWSLTLQTRADARGLFLQATQLIAAEYAAAIKYAQDKYNLSQQNLAAGLRAETAYVDQKVAAALATVNANAAAGFASAEKVRESLIQKTLDLIATHYPLVSDLVKRLASIIVDLVEVDNPAIRVIAQVLVTQIIDHLGVDNAVGALLSDLIGPLLGQGRPQTLAQVVATLESQDVALNQLWQQLNGSGLPEIEQAGRLWEGMDSPAFTAGLVAFLGLAITDPVRAASVTSDAIGGVDQAVIDIIDAVRALPADAGGAAAWLGLFT